MDPQELNNTVLITIYHPKPLTPHHQRTSVDAISRVSVASTAIHVSLLIRDTILRSGRLIDPFKKGRDDRDQIVSKKTARTWKTRHVQLKKPT